MRVADFVRISCGTMKMLSKFGIRMDDFKYVDLFLDYEAMKGEGYKTTYIVACLSSKYSLSESSVYRVLKKFKITF